MKIDPKGKTPPRTMITAGSMNHFFSGIGRGTALIRQGKSGCPAKLRPSTVPTSVRGSITNMQMHVTATCEHRTRALVTLSGSKTPPQILYLRQPITVTEALIPAPKLRINDCSVLVVKYTCMFYR